MGKKMLRRNRKTSTFRRKQSISTGSSSQGKSQEKKGDVSLENGGQPLSPALEEIMHRTSSLNNPIQRRIDQQRLMDIRMVNDKLDKPKKKKGLIHLLSGR